MSRPGRSSAEHVRAVALGFPEATEEMTWDVHPTFRVRNKMFVILSEDGATATVKATLEEQRALVHRSPDAYAVASYVGRFGWVSVALAAADQAEVAELVEDAWRSVAPKRLVTAWEQRTAPD
jgi:hypothetical protein